MKTLIVEDNETNAVVLRGLLTRYGQCTVVVNGLEGVKTMREALETGKPFDLICLDVMMPEMDGQTALREMRNLEEELNIAERNRARIIMTTSASDKVTVVTAIQARCDGYLVKPIGRIRLMEELRKLNLL